MQLSSFYFLVSYHWSPERDQDLPLHCSPWEWGHSSAFFSPRWTNQVTSDTPFKSCCWGLSPSWSVSFRHTVIGWYPSFTETPKLHAVLEMGLLHYRGQSPPSIGSWWCAWCTPSCPLWLPGYTGGSYSTCHELKPSDFSHIEWLFSLSPPVCMYNHNHPFQGQTLALALVKFHMVGGCPTLWSIQIFL